MEHHIDHYFDEALTSLKQQISLMSKKVDEMLNDCKTALVKKDMKLAEALEERDQVVNALEVAIDEQCIELLARYQPAASDLRFITRGLKIVTDLERVGDLTVNIASRTVEILKEGEPPIDLSHMFELVITMFKSSVEAFINKDESKAKDVLVKDDLVDDSTTKHVKEMIQKAKQDPSKIGIYFPFSSIVRYLERISDHSTNIAELAIFTAKGRDVRHGREG